MIASCNYLKKGIRKVYYDYNKLPPIIGIIWALATQMAVLSHGERTRRKEKIWFKMDFIILNDDALFFISVTSSTGDRNRVYHRHNEIKKLVHQIIES
jgi:hypothetical protein